LFKADHFSFSASKHLKEVLKSEILKIDSDSVS